MAGPSTQRLFFALWPDDVVRRRLVESLAEVGSGVRGRRVPPERLHVTLLFLGNVTAEIRTVAESVAEAVAVPSFDLVLDRVGYWPRARVVWFGATSVPPEILELYQGLATGVSGCGLQLESRPYTPHLTLIRDARARPGGAHVVAVRWPVQTFSLVASENGANGLQYRVLRSWPLLPAGDPGSRC